MIYSLYIFHKNGHLLFSQNLRDVSGILGKRDSPDLISGLLSAMSQFAESLGGRGVQKIEMEENYSIIGVSSPKYCIRFVILTDLKDNKNECHFFLRRCRASFIRKYRKNLQKIKMGGLVNTEIFLDWGKNLNSLSENLELTSIEETMTSTIKQIVDVMRLKPKKKK